MKRIIILLFSLFSVFALYAQNPKIDMDAKGMVRIQDMFQDTMAYKVVVWKDDKVLGYRTLENLTDVVQSIYKDGDTIRLTLDDSGVWDRYLSPEEVIAIVADSNFVVLSQITPIQDSLLSLYDSVLILQGLVVDTSAFNTLDSLLSNHLLLDMDLDSTNELYNDSMVLGLIDSLFVLDSLSSEGTGDSIELINSKLDSLFVLDLLDLDKDSTNELYNDSLVLSLIDSSFTEIGSLYDSLSSGGLVQDSINQLVLDSIFSISATDSLQEIILSNLDSVLQYHIVNDLDTNSSNELDTIYTSLGIEIVNGDTIFFFDIFESSDFDSLVNMLTSDITFIDSLTNTLFSTSAFTDSIISSLIESVEFKDSIGVYLYGDSIFVDSLSSSLFESQVFQDSISSYVDSALQVLNDPCLLDMSIPITYTYTLAGPATDGPFYAINDTIYAIDTVSGDTIADYTILSGTPDTLVNNATNDTITEFELVTDTLSIDTLLGVVDVGFLSTSPEQGGYFSPGDYELKAVTCNCEVGGSTAIFDIVADGVPIGQNFTQGVTSLSYSGLSGDNITIMTVDGNLAAHCWFSIHLMSKLPCD